jgi:CheY-like chemotaxis protein
MTNAPCTDASTVARDPTAAQPPVEPPAITSTAHAGPPRPGISPLRLRVLVVDDNRDAADILGGLLSLAGADVRVCYDAVAAVAAAAEFRPDAGVFDVGMPGTDGCALAAAVRAGAGGRPVLLVAVSGLDEEAVLRRTGGSAFNVRMVKPADPRELIATLSGFDLWLRSGGTPAAS